MGAWGHGLFQSDHDLDIVSELTHEAGVYELKENKVKKKAEETNGVKAEQKADTKDNDTDDDDDDFVYESICHPEDMELVRNHLDSGVLVKMLDKYESMLLSNSKKEQHKAMMEMREPGYIFMILGACAMTCGCKIPKTYKTTMQKVYTCVDLPKDAIQQMKKALNGPNGFKDGEPYDFDSPGLVETANMDRDPEPSSGGFHMLNVWGPGTMFYQPPKGSTKGLEDLKAAKANEVRFGKDVCGGCGAKEKEGGGPLQDCAKCKARRYCGRECQKKQWHFHQRVCQASASGKENEMM